MKTTRGWAALLGALLAVPQLAVAATTVQSQRTPDGSKLVEIGDFDRRQVFELWVTGLVPPSPRRRVGPRVDALRDVEVFAIAPDSSRVVWKELNTAAGGSKVLSSPWSAAAALLSSGLVEVGHPTVACDSKAVRFLAAAVSGAELTPHCAPLAGGNPVVGECPPVACNRIFVDGFETGATGAWR